MSSPTQRTKAMASNMKNNKVEESMRLSTMNESATAIIETNKHGLNTDQTSLYV